MGASDYSKTNASTEETFGASAPIAMSVLSYVQNFALDTVKHVRLTLDARGPAQQLELQAAYLQDRVETTAAYAQEIVELARDMPLGRRVPLFGAGCKAKNQN